MFSSTTVTPQIPNPERRLDVKHREILRVHKRYAAFTLIELLICLIIISLICCYLMPISPSLLSQNQCQLTKDSIKQAIIFSKIQTIMRGNQLMLTTSDWSRGAELYELTKPFDRFPSISGETKGKTLVHQWTWGGNGIHVSWAGFQSKQYLRFSPSLNQSAINGVFVIDCTNRKSMRLVVNRLGTMREE